MSSTAPRDGPAVGHASPGCPPARRKAAPALLLLLCACATPGGGATGPRSPASATARGATIVLVHGAWGGGWDWRGVERGLRARGHEVWRPTLTGLGERVHLSRPDLGLSVHVEDVVNTLVWEDLHDVILVGHSYGGFVISGAAERVPERIRRLVYLDAFLPEDGDSVASLLRAHGAGAWLDGLVRGDLLVPPWVVEGAPPPHDVPQPRRTFEEPLRLSSAAARGLAATYVLTVDPGAAPDQDPFFPYAERARARGLTVVHLAADHVPERSAPGPLVELLDAAAAP